MPSIGVSSHSGLMGSWSTEPLSKKIMCSDSDQVALEYEITSHISTLFVSHLPMQIISSGQWGLFHTNIVSLIAQAE